MRQHIIPEMRAMQCADFLGHVVLCRHADSCHWLYNVLAARRNGPLSSMELLRLNEILDSTFSVVGVRDPDIRRLRFPFAARVFTHCDTGN